MMRSGATVYGLIHPREMCRSQNMGKLIESQ
jgi:hypothetical protein